MRKGRSSGANRQEVEEKVRERVKRIPRDTDDYLDFISDNGIGVYEDQIVTLAKLGHDLGNGVIELRSVLNWVMPFPSKEDNPIEHQRLLNDSSRIIEKIPLKGRIRATTHTGLYGKIGRNGKKVPKGLRGKLEDKYAIVVALLGMSFGGVGYQVMHVLDEKDVRNLTKSRAIDQLHAWKVLNANLSNEKKEEEDPGGDDEFVFDVYDDSDILRRNRELGEKAIPKELLGAVDTIIEEIRERTIESKRRADAIAQEELDRRRKELQKLEEAATEEAMEEAMEEPEEHGINPKWLLPEARAARGNTVKKQNDWIDDL
jgi:hypothetical protein